ncbi:MAG: hypothetical protein VW079_01960 [Candidatus Woesearchaeota archaeon]
MRGQFFLIGIIVTAVILLLSLNVLSSNEKIFLSDDKEKYFDNFNFAYEYSIPGNWEYFDEAYRSTIGICINPSNQSMTNWWNTSINLNSENDCVFTSENYHVTQGNECTLFINASNLSSYLDSDTNCGNFIFYYNSTSGIEESNASQGTTGLNISLVSEESITHSPINSSINITKFYLEKNILVDETAYSSGTYTINYSSENLDFEGTI